MPADAALRTKSGGRDEKGALEKAPGAEVSGAVAPARGHVVSGDRAILRGGREYRRGKIPAVGSGSGQRGARERAQALGTRIEPVLAAVRGGQGDRDHADQLFTRRGERTPATEPRLQVDVT